VTNLKTEMMMFISYLGKKLSIPLIAAILLLAFLSSCSPIEPTSVSIPTLTPSATLTYTPEPPTATPAPETEQEGEGLLLPSPTPGPTVTPGVITEFVGQFAEATGLYQKTFFGVNVEDWLNLGASIIMGLLVGYLLSRLVYFALEKAVARTVTKYDDALLKVIRPQISLVFIVIGFQVGTLRLPFINVVVKQWLSQLYIAIYVVAATIILWRMLDALVEWYQNDVEPERDPHQIDTLLVLLHRVARVLLVTVSAIMLLSLYNINVNALIAALGVGGLAISLAAQDTLSNIISGIMIMMDQPFRVGDRIEIQGLGTWGDVVDIGLRSTRIRTRDNRLVIIPNNSISTDQIVNYTYPDPQYRIQIEIGIGYGQDIEKVRQIIVDAVREVEGVLPDKPVDALYVEMGESAMIFRVRWWIESFVDTRRMFDRVNTTLQLALDEAGVDMPFNTYDIRVLNMPGKNEDLPHEEEI
jgi:small-conductance mechanosensitive channel